MKISSRGRGELWDFFQHQTKPFLSRQALTAPQGEMTFAGIFAAVDKLCGLLSRAGVKEGRIVALALPNSLAFIPAYLALVKLTSTVALVSPKYRESELQSIFTEIDPFCLLTVGSIAENLVDKITFEERSVLSIPELGEDFLLLFPNRPHPDSSPAAALDAALIKFTSGSTGVPKGIALTADNVIAEAGNVVATLELSPGDQILAPVPIFHSYGFDLAVLSMLSAGTPLIMRDAFIPRRMLEDLANPKVTLFLGVPSMYHIFTETFLPAIPDLRHIRYLLSCTAPLSPELITAFYQKFHMPICQHYGSSETGAAANHNPEAVLGRLDSVGKAMKNVKIMIMDDNGETLPAGMEGEVVVQSQVVAPGYIMGEPPGKSKFGDHTYWTGDIGSLDEEGFLYLRGRKDDVINVGGFKVSPYEVARVIESHAAVREAAVIGIKDAIGEEVVYAVVTLKAQATEEEILTFCRSRLADYKIPRRVEIRGEMPRGPSGKIKLTSQDIHL